MSNESGSKWREKKNGFKFCICLLQPGISFRYRLIQVVEIAVNNNQIMQIKQKIWKKEKVNAIYEMFVSFPILFFCFVVGLSLR